MIVETIDIFYRNYVEISTTFKSTFFFKIESSDGVKESSKFLVCSNVFSVVPLAYRPVIFSVIISSDSNNA